MPRRDHSYYTPYYVIFRYIIVNYAYQTPLSSHYRSISMPIFCHSIPFKHQVSFTVYGRQQGRPLGLYFAAVVSSFFLVLFFPRLFSAVGDWMSTIFPHNDVALVRI